MHIGVSLTAQQTVAFCENETMKTNITPLQHNGTSLDVSFLRADFASGALFARSKCMPYFAQDSI